MEVNIDRIKKDLDTLNSFNMTPGKGITRLTFSPEYMKAYNYVIAQLEKIGAEVTICRAGCIRGRINGSDPAKPAVMSGSHIDTVLNGGPFDGQVGTLSALEVARVVVENEVSHTCPIDVVVFPEEEGVRFRFGMAASSTWAGSMELEKLYKTRDSEGVTYQEAMESAGIVVEDESQLVSENVKAMLEVHIEQSVILDRRGLSIGVVESIAGAKWCDLVITGKADHAGGTPMAYRRDALQGAARIIGALEDIAANQMGPHTVGTCGYIKVEPGVGNVIPGRVEMVFDLRDSKASNLEKMVAKIDQVAEGICRERGLGLEMSERFSIPPVEIPTYLADLIFRCAEKRGMKPLRMMSGALHDSCKLAPVTDIGMIFVPSKDGRSHCPEEWTELEDIKAGADVLLDAVVELAA
ncbi:MAG: Zn-dependent hydrolase [Deltaproteobacteria bacterium]|nr:Zn-dependent hydrolase [Deltaproteobacteria bacterium]MBW2122078.1 Zn-dependent hydrolase [Deltaproteobacteria bacterium]